MFVALEMSIRIIESIRSPVQRIRARDTALYRQIRAAASSVSLNLAEGNERSGKDRLHCWRIGAGSAAELRAALRVARAWGDVRSDEIDGSVESIDQLLRILRALTR